jgi:hypothetical protein
MELASRSLHQDATTSVFDVVHPGYLTPPDHPIRGSLRTDAGLVLDRELVRLAGMDARCRFVQAAIARRLIQSRAWRRIGFVRLSDYARERLGCSPRTLEEDAHVFAALDALPLLRDALQRGELSWTQARLLVRIATPQNERFLLERTAQLTTRELESLVRRPASPADGSDAARSSPDPVNEAADEEPSLRLTMQLSPRGRREWLSASEIASRAAGTPLSPAQVLELVVSECASGVPVPGNDSPFHGLTIDEHEARLRSRAERDERRGQSCLQFFLAEMGVIEGFAWLGRAEREAGPAAELDMLLHELDAVDDFELDRRLREVRGVTQRIDYQLATLLRIGVDRRLFREIGFATVKLYVEARLGICARRVWSLLAIERVSWRCRPLREAWREGRVSHLAARTLLLVVGEEHGEAWIQRAGEITLRALTDQVAWALDSGDRSGFSSKPAPPPAHMSIPVGGVPSVDLNEVQMRAHGDDPRDRMDCAGATRLVLHVPLSVAALLELQLDRYRHGIEQRWRTFERLVSLAILEWTSVPRHRDPVFERDGWRCVVPGCSSRRNLHDHHVVFRSHGGDSSRGNRVTVCAAHHLHGIHVGIVRAEGKAPDQIEWALGCRPGRTPAMRLRGDRYIVSRAAPPARDPRSSGDAGSSPSRP